ncbi:MAG: carboxypeptidase regulatory-like domain-containing protein [Acidobacteriaceae bacterium]|nr:carboxypeptidase regulatory-like domain-containing protein [Acidobacteriaceae bacterium]
MTILVGFVPQSRAQDATSGQIAGNLSDPSGAMVPNAQVTITNLGTGQTVTVPTNSLGHYVAPLLPPEAIRCRPRRGDSRRSLRGQSMFRRA